MRERVKCSVFPNANQMARAVAVRIAALIRERTAEGEQAVLGLATGSTPTSVYAELIRMHEEEDLSFRDVVTFNLDEYFPMQPDELQSYVRFMKEHLFDHIDIAPDNVHIPDGTVDASHVGDYCQQYEANIADAGGIDIQLLGIGRTGHIGFNEPGSGNKSRTRLITLDTITRTDAASDFFGAENVPRRAITMGVGTILDAKSILMMAMGEHKAPIIARTVEGDVSPSVPATFLQEHDNVEFLLDSAAAAKLTRLEAPWLLGEVEWDTEMIRRAAVWLSEKVGRPVLKLTDADYNEEGLQGLLASHGSAYDINLAVFRGLQATITGWPAGKPKELLMEGDQACQQDDVFPKRVLVFSPHPDDDVISMGGTLSRLADQGHEVHVAYQTSGNIAVFDHDAIRFAEFASDYCREFDALTDRIGELESHVEDYLKSKAPGQVDSDIVRRLKALIRRSEARDAARCCGVTASRLHFLEMPFYETGVVKKKPLSGEDVQIVVDLLREVQPHQIYAAGDLSDPHGTHRTCLDAVFRACDSCAGDDWAAGLEVWLYRGAWQEWATHEIEMAVPLSPQEVERKRAAIFRHESQKDRALFPGPDMREFWQRAEARNAETARSYDALGLAEYAAIEGFVQRKVEQ